VREVPNFAGGARNLWFGLNIDDMNPFKMKKNEIKGVAAP
jgi:hypothetical protein